jgi:hypothetical protein
MFFSENRLPPRITSGAGFFFRDMRQEPDGGRPELDRGCLRAGGKNSEAGKDPEGNGKRLAMRAPNVAAEQEHPGPREE